MPNSRVVHEVLQVPGHDDGNFNKLVRQVVGEVDVVSNTAGHSRDVREETVHAVLVPVWCRDEQSENHQSMLLRQT